ncbi:MHS family MFS transporter [Micrococcaceae bacterium RIT802]|nr:MHS family MFS transporter [Micrococcaceae bacterium RIT 802]
MTQRKQRPETQDAVVDPQQLKRATLAASVGSALEYYDFYIYGLATALIFSPLFFSPLGMAGGVLASAATYAVGFAARPFGGIIFGALGDRFGRKSILLVTVALMGSASFLIGVLPTYATAGVLAPVLLVALRILQGLGAGAEQAGATVLISEFAPPSRRGFFASLPFVGIQIGTLLGAGTFAVLAANVDNLAESWLWRVPFLASALLIAVAIYIRLRLQESPAFTKMEENKTVVKNPAARVWRNSRGNVLKGIGLRMAENGNSSIYNVLVLIFITGLDYDDAASIGTTGALIAATVAIFTVVLFGRLSDRIGRVTLYRWGAAFQGIIALPAFYLLTLGEPVLVWLVMAVGIGIGVQSMLGPQCALLPELFGTAHRYTGVALAREFSAVLAGGIAPLIGGALLAVFSDGAWWALGLYSLVLCLITFATTFVTPETMGRDILSSEDA